MKVMLRNEKWQVRECDLRDLTLGFPPGTQLGNYYEALARYKFVYDLVAGKRVLDVGCGSGYGALCLAHSAAQVTAVDINLGCIRRAMARHRRENLRFHAMDSSQLEFSDASFDVVVCFQVVEWMSQPRHYMRELRRVCRTAGVCVLSWLNAERLVKPGKLHPHHVSEYSMKEMGNILTGVFPSVRVYSQRNWWTVGQRETSPVGRLASKAKVLLASPRLLATTVQRQVATRVSDSPSVRPEIEDSVFQEGVIPDAKFFVACCEA